MVPYSEKDIIEQREWLKKRQKRQEEEQKILREEALSKAQEIAEFIREKYGVTNVYLFGSLADENALFTPISDIDIFIAGKIEGSFFKMVAECVDLAVPFQVHLVLEEDAPASLVEKVYREGKKL